MLNGKGGRGGPLIGITKFTRRLAEAEGGGPLKKGVFLDNETGDLYRYDRDVDKIVPYAKCGVWLAPLVSDARPSSAPSAGGRGVQSLPLPLQQLQQQQEKGKERGATEPGSRPLRYVPEFGVHKLVPKLVPGREDELKVALVKMHLQHPLLRGIKGQRFLASCASKRVFFDECANRTSTHPYVILAITESSHRPLLVERGNVVALHCNVTAEHPETATMLDNFVASKVGMVARVCVWGGGYM